MSGFQGRTFAAGVCVACLALAAAPATATEANLKYSKPLNLPAIDQEELVAAALDGDVYEVTRAGLPDLRLYDLANREVPFLLRKSMTQREESTREAWTARRPPSARPLENNGLEITLELDRQEPMPDGLKFVSPLQNFEQHVQVEFSSDGRVWHPLVSDGLIFDYARYLDVRHDTVRWTSHSHGVAGDKEPEDAPLRRIRITIDNVTQAQESQLIELTRSLQGEAAAETSERLIVDRRPFRIDRVELFRDKTRPQVTGERLVDYPLSGMEIINDETAKRTQITVDSRRDPLTSFSLVTAAHNFSRAAAIEVEREEGRNAWRTVRAGNLSRIDFRDLDHENLKISMAETRQPRYRLVIENRDSPPLQITGLTAAGPVYEVVFLADPKSEYRLAYGSSSVSPPDYDTAALAASLSAGYTPLAAELGEQSAGAEDVVTGEPLYQRLINDTRLLTMAIAVLVVALGFGLYQASRRVNNHLS